jgi:toxin ParE1/3/4
VPVGRVPVQVRPRAQLDIDDAIDRYLEEAGAGAAVRFADAVVEAFDLLERNPGLGSPREGFGLPGLRAWPMRPWPYLVFYIRGPRVLDLVRVLHGARDIPATLAEPETR